MLAAVSERERRSLVSIVHGKRKPWIFSYGDDCAPLVAARHYHEKMLSLDLMNW